MLTSSVLTSCIAIIQDGMDQSKLKLPRTGVRSAKLFTRLFRPQLHLVVTWLHGHMLHYFISDADLKKDSETSIETLSRCLSRLYNNMGKLPVGMVLQQDNTYREGKNRWVLGFLCLLVCLRVFRYTVAGFLRPGHSNLNLLQNHC